MADANPEIKIKIGAETTEGENGLRRISNASKKTAAETKGSFEQIQGAVGKVQGAFGALRNVLTGFGIGAVVGALNAGIGKIAESFESAKKSAEAFNAIQRKLAEETGIATLVQDYARLTDAINAAAAAENHQLEMLDIAVQGRRRLADARLEAAKEDEVAKLDANAKDYAEQLDRVEKKYAALKARQNAGNAEEDLVLARQKLESEAVQKERAADAQDAASNAIQAKIAQAQREKSKADIQATELNDKDKTGAASAVGKTLGQIFSGEWGRVKDAKTEEGDEVRRAAAEKSAATARRIQELTEELRKSREAALKLRSEAANARDKRDAMGPQIEAARLEGETTSRSVARGAASAQDALDRKRAEIARDEATIAEGAERIAKLKGDAAFVKGEARDAEADNAHEQRDVYEAQQALDLFNMQNRGRHGGSIDRKRAELSEAVVRETNEAQESEAKLKATLSTLATTLKAINDAIREVERKVNEATSRQKSAQTDAPAGD